MYQWRSEPQSPTADTLISSSPASGHRVRLVVDPQVPGSVEAGGPHPFDWP